MILGCCAGKVGSFQKNSHTNIQARIAEMHKIVEDKTSGEISYPLLSFTAGE